MVQARVCKTWDTGSNPVSASICANILTDLASFKCRNISTMILVTNDFPPKVGGIQNYLYELWSRLPITNTRVITTKYSGAKEFDSKQDFNIERYSKILWPTPKLVHYINTTIKEVKSDVVFIDPLLPTGLITSRIKNVSKILIIHGAEVTVPGRIYPSRALIRHIMTDCDLVVSAGNYAASQLVRATGKPIDLVRIPPGVDTKTFIPPTTTHRENARQKLCTKLGIEPTSRILMSASRLVPRKGFDVAISALAELETDIHLVVVGTGRDKKRLSLLAKKKNVSDRVHFLGRVSFADLIETYHASDLFIMLCRDRWKSLEAEGFGIVFLEAQACGLPVIVGRSGGSPESLLDGKSGYVVDPESVFEVKQAIRNIIGSQEKLSAFGNTGRAFVERDHSYDYLATLLFPLVNGDLSSAKKYEG